MEPLIHRLKEFQDDYQINETFRPFVWVFIGCILLVCIPDIAGYGGLLLLYTSPLWVLKIAPKSASHYWMHYVHHHNLSQPNQAPMLLEVKLSSTIIKSPRAMELVFEAMHIRPSMTTPFQTQWRGNVAPWWSFEIVSDAGQLHFYIWGLRRMRARLESAIYAHYPDVQLVEVQDYTKHFSFNPETMSVLGTNFMFDTEDAHPIKTYYDFGLEKDPKTEHKIDPLVSMLEVLGSIKSGKVCLQILIRQAAGDKEWRARVSAAIQAMYDATSPEFADLSDPDKMTKGSAILRPMQYEYIKAMQRATTKAAFDVGIRFLYVAPKEQFSGTVGHQVMNMFKYTGQRKGPYYNMIVPDGDSYLANFDWPWEDFNGMYAAHKTRKLFEAYTTRSFFTPPIIDDPIIMTSEQLATIYHFPGLESQALGLERLESKRGAPPADLPL